MDNSQLPTPHNNFFHYAFSHLSAVRSLIEAHLPTEVIKSLDLDSLELQKGTFVDKHLRESYSDILYSVQLASNGGPSTEGLVYLLLEHKSDSDDMTCFQLLRYIVRIWEQRWRNKLLLCPVIPLVIYHGETAWSAPRSLDEITGATEALAKYGVRFTFPLLDLGQIPDDSLSSEPFLQSVLRLLKYGRRSELADQLERILRGALETRATTLPHDHLEAYVIYIMAVSRVIPLETLAMTVQKIFPTQIEPGSIADQLLKKGRSEGEIRLIQTLQEILGVEVSDESTLQGKSIDELQALTAELREQIKKRN